ncbi:MULTISPECIES: caspase family protein [unclassified Microcystis]|jgi:branched-chain amino acid transport system substrate-binding protein|uniref:Caspase n=3 Tax=Microcystis TaxID=1125 RepID=A0A552KRP9_9CHRO|nr:MULTISPECIES: caspase family protein [unclassified Microcystis]MCA2854582.1 ABC transporter substrate-binding protein [Microcystis sp. M065S1]TRT97938.1 MAG: caspase [Microcystis flos-aquae Ma_QC_C_20070823_S18D]TRV10648.1 MAG: caspase [Microcystis flos-aquae Mf_QC_C_20070823_S10D]TRV29240.1 MAG: caspase [Microcystis flos-aquae Mf_QC_C_20070823_S10]TRV32214.1 MAG: caspase [Microcystis flos-aquae Mf_QC_C_20070823_S20T]TRV33826.1 MAG: caspase [Microcystis flos-aquae Mf_QC_C_20070823_S20D]TR
MAKFALLIGVSEYSAGLRPISSAILDVEAMRRVLEHPDMGAFDQVTVLPNPDKGSMEKAVEVLFADRQRDDLVLLYFTGHGLKDQKARFFLSTRDTGRDQKGNFSLATALAATKLQEYITDSSSQRQIIILDCCFSGALVQGMPIKGEFNIQEELGGRGRAILTSSSPIEYSFESEDNGLSIYTKYLVEGIETGAADQDGDQLISVNELHEYASERVKEAAPAMTPKFYLSLEGDDTIYLARSPLAANDPKFKYRKIVEDIIKKWNDEDIKDYCFKEEDFSAADRAVLDATIDQLNLSPDEARTIETEVLNPLLRRRDNIKKYRNAFRKIIAAANHTPLSSRDRESLKKLQIIYGLRDEDIQFIEKKVKASLMEKILHFIKNFKLNLPVSIGIASIAVVSLFAIYRHNIITPLIPSDCPKQTGDFISEGEEVLNYSQSFNKKKGTEYFAQCDYQKALLRFKDAWQQDRLDAETLIYLNNALLEANKMQYYTIAVAVSIPKNQSDFNDDDGDSRAKEMLRGVAQLQTKINLGLLNDNDPFLKYFPDQNFINKKAINGKGLKVVITNDENDELLAQKTASSLSQRPEILGVVGHYPSEMTVATVDIYNQNNLVLISPGSTTSELTKYPRKNFLRTVFSIDQQSPAIAKFLQEKSIKKVVGFYSEGSPFSEYFFNSFKTIFTRPPFSGTVVKLDEFDLGNNFKAEEAIQELRRQTEAKITETIGLVLFPKAIGDAQGDAIRLIKLNNSQNWVIGSWGLRSSRTLEQIDNLQPFQKFVIAVPWDSLTSPNQDFLKDAKILWTTTSVNAITALSYDATLALTKALEKANTPTRINIREQLKSPDFLVTKGATGTIKFDENGDRKKIDENGEPQNPSVEFVHIVECRTLSSDFAFVPIKYPTAKDAGLSCLNSPKKPSP